MYATRTDLTRRVLLSLLAVVEDTPLSDDMLIDCVSVRFMPRPTRGDVIQAIKDAEQSGYIHGATVPLEGVVWTLTTKGQLKARELR